MLIYVEEVAAFCDLPEALQEYLESESEKLKSRAAYVRGDCEWWKFTWPLHKEHYSKSKLLCPYLASSNRFALDESANFIGLTDTTVIFDREQPESLRYVFGLLDSKLLEIRFKSIAKLKGNGIYEYVRNSLQNLPIGRIDFDDSTDVAKHDKMVVLVDRMVEFHKKLASDKNPETRRHLQTLIDTTDRQIDRLVYDLYSLTSDEVKMVEWRQKGW